MSANRAVRSEEEVEARPFVLGYSERRPVEERCGRYDEVG